MEVVSDCGSADEEAPALGGGGQFFGCHVFQPHHAGNGNHGAVVGAQPLRREEDSCAALAAGFDQACAKRFIGGNTARDYQLLDTGCFDRFDGLGGKYVSNGFGKGKSQI